LAEKTNAIIKFVIRSNSSGSQAKTYILNFTINPPEVYLLVNEIEPENIATVVSCTDSVFESLVSGQSSPAMAYMMGSIQVDGRLDVANKLQKFLKIMNN
jgi:putative sterol carrier protein